MTADKHFKRQIRDLARAEQISYTTARTRLLAAQARAVGASSADCPAVRCRCGEAVLVLDHLRIVPDGRRGAIPGADRPIWVYRCPACRAEAVAAPSSLTITGKAELGYLVPAAEDDTGWPGHLATEDERTAHGWPADLLAVLPLACAVDRDRQRHLRRSRPCPVEGRDRRRWRLIPSIPHGFSGQSPYPVLGMDGWPSRGHGSRTSGVDNSGH